MFVNIKLSCCSSRNDSHGAQGREFILLLEGLFFYSKKSALRLWMSRASLMLVAEITVNLNRRTLTYIYVKHTGFLSSTVGVHV